MSLRKNITASDLFNFDKCSYKPFIDRHGDPSKKIEVPPLLKLLWDGGVQHEANIISDLRKKENLSLLEINPESPASKELFEQTLRGMKEGKDLIYQGVLISEERVGRPDLLVKAEGSSKFGNYHYYPMDIKAAFRDEAPKGGEKYNRGHAWQLYFYSELLERVQGAKPKIGKIFKTESRVIDYSMIEVPFGYQDAIKYVESYHRGESSGREPEIGSKCGLCVWRDSCSSWAKENNDLTQLFWLGGKVKYGLYQLGIRNIQDLAKTDAKNVKAKVPDLKANGFFWKSMPSELVDDLIRRAQIFFSGKESIRVKPSFPESDIEIHYDVEDDPTQDFVYLHGFLIVRRGFEPEYEAFFADSKDQEETVTQEVWKFLEGHRNTPIYYYSAKEPSTLKHLADKYPSVDRTLVEEIFGEDRMSCDLYRWIEEFTDWPLTSYGLKSICKHLGFNWSAEDAGGANSVVWINEYLKGQSEKKNKILEYNEEDCRATLFLKQKLMEVSE